MIEDRAKSAGQSINKTIKEMLEQSLGLRPSAENRHADDFAEFLGVWKPGDIREFERLASEFRQIDKEDWQ
jgi:hypothetical protein